MKMLLLIMGLFIPKFTFSQGLSIKHVVANCYVFTTYSEIEGGKYPANGMYVITDQGALLMDTPWDTTQFKPLADSIEARHHKKIIYVLATHFHDDRAGGLAYYEAHSALTWSSALTKQWCILNRKDFAKHTFVSDTVFNIGNCKFQVFYPGKGHSPDNIVVWFPDQKLLYGGCFIKSTETESIGNLSDADTHAWAISAKRVQKKFKDAAYVIPGHLNWQSKDAIKHTLKLINRDNRQK